MAAGMQRSFAGSPLPPPPSPVCDMPPPLDVSGDVFRDAPLVRNLLGVCPSGPVSAGVCDDGLGNRSESAAGWQPTAQDVVLAYKEQGSPTPLRVHLPVGYPTLPPRLSRASSTASTPAPSSPAPRFVLHGAAVKGPSWTGCAGRASSGPAARTGDPSSSLTPASALAGLTLGTVAAAGDGVASSGGSSMDEDILSDHGMPDRTEQPDVNPSVMQTDRPVPGMLVGPEELYKQQQALVGHQLAHDEARARTSIVMNPKAQYYTRHPHAGPVVDPMRLSGYAPMEIDGAPNPREPLAHAHVVGGGSDVSDNDLYHPPSFDENGADDPPGLPRLPHLFTGSEQEGMRLMSGERRYYHDVPIRNSASVSAAMTGASADVPQIYSIPDVVRDAYHLTGGNAGPPQPASLPFPNGALQFMPLPASGVAPLHLDDPEALLKGLAAERVHVIFRQPQSTMVLVRIYNGGVPRAHNVKQQSDALAEAITTITNATDFIIVPPAQSWNHELSQQDQPMTWLVLRLVAAHVRTLVRQLLWSSHRISFVALNRDLRFSRFIGRIGYYTHNVDQDIENSIRRTFAGPLILPSVRSLVASHPHIQPDQVDPAVDRVLKSLRVTVVTYPNGSIIANVYCDSPTHSVEAWRTWVAYVHTVPFWSDLNPTGSFLRPIRCAGCSGADHPTFMCPYALIAGWNGPAPGAATIEGPMAPLAPVTLPQAGRGNMQRGVHPYRGGNTRGRRGRGRGLPVT
ncbi:hypothetical protein C8T65DRAFT_696189 [Cerioporus squamosus]|nr:hypothetical protein C8T65DRAFT_696189 [Cerioporus squamosus]